MKKTLLVLLCMALAAALAPPVLADNTVVEASSTIDSLAIAAGATYTGLASAVGSGGFWDFKRCTGQLGVQVQVQGAGTLKVEYLTSMDGTWFAEPSGASDILSGVTSGDGWVTGGVSLKLGKYGTLRLTETGSANAITVTVKTALERRQ